MTSLPSSPCDNKWQFCRLTPPGRGAVATIAARGAGLPAALAGLFRPAKASNALGNLPGRAIYGQFRSSDCASEDVVIGLVATEEAEIHCHGGEAAARAICSALANAGGEEINPAAWPALVISDPISTDALWELSHARTWRASAILLDQYRGALRSELKRIDKLLLEGDPESAECSLAALLQYADLGLHLTRPWRVVFAGRPNVGKSSLMNAILGYHRSIVWPDPGTTRDVLSATTALDGWWVELCDVAGLRQSMELVESAGVLQAEQQIATSDLVLYVADATIPWDAPLFAQVKDLLNPAVNNNVRFSPAPRLLIVHNKYDLVDASADHRPAGIATSARTGWGLSDLCDSIIRRLLPVYPPSGAPIPFTSRQVQILQDALIQWNNSDPASARKLINSLLAPAS